MWLRRLTQRLGRLLRDAQHVKLFDMIKSFQHKGLRKLYETGSLAGVQASHGRRLRMRVTTAMPMSNISKTTTSPR